MCLAIPGQDPGSGRRAEPARQGGCRGGAAQRQHRPLDEEPGGVGPGDWVLIHVGFALSKVDEAEAIATRRMLEGMGADYEQELEELKASVIE